MRVEQHMSTFAGRRVFWYHEDGSLSINAPGFSEWGHGAAERTGITPSAEESNPSVIAYAIRGSDVELGEEGPDLVGMIDRLAEDPKIGLVEALVLGLWDSIDGDSTPVIEALVAARDRFAGLKALFLGDIVREESESLGFNKGTWLRSLRHIPYWRYSASVAGAVFRLRVLSVMETCVNSESRPVACPRRC